MKIEFGNGYTLQDWGTAWGDGDQDRLIALADDYDIWANLGDNFPHPYNRADAEAWVALQSGRDPVEHFAICDVAGPIGGMGLTTRQGDLLMTLSWLRSLSARVVIPELHRSCFFCSDSSQAPSEGALLPGHPSAQGLITSIPLPSKSPMSLVTTDAPRLRAIAAIWQSAWLMGRPAARRAAAITA